jgi:hypothetical protein
LRGIVFLRPKLLAVRGIETADEFIRALAGEDIEFVANDGWGGVAQADGDFPFLG